MSETNPPTDNAALLAERLAERLESRGREYALGGAIALGFWATPRGTVDVDLTVFLPPERPSDCLWLLQDIGCEFCSSEAAASLGEHGFCRVALMGMQLNVFLPIVPFYESARKRRKRLSLAGRRVMVWDAESLAVFKMMFFRRKDLADVEQILRSRGGEFDRRWVRAQLLDMYGANDPRLIQWDELASEISSNHC